MTLLPDAVRGADSVLISGPPMSGKYDLFNRLLATWADGPVVISTGRTAEKVRGDYEELTGEDGDDVIVIDCVTHEQGDKREDTPTTKYVASAGNLTDIGIKFTDVVESSTGRERAVGVYSLSQLLMYWDPERIYRFTRVMTSQASGEGWPFVGVVGSTAHDEQVVHTLHEPFEVVETRVDDDDREFRVRGRVGQPSDWQPF
ncbi:hypothetical protein [Halorubrum sp. GN11GM_10-3_MGM]|uniref:DUF7504 family protein n=1 Tax=Halorubrum sp. GN11GM_10-3_MGM TaxID=2518111 RepID=UPI0010F7E245|nr:hypothetical protein [Halorubrum sp. GN11GM_10-3_MGM]TKX70477.1 hypothetical protein EXE40_09005 [Halorubrum sp. GN11GM_10-3_MGM]